MRRVAGTAVLAAALTAALAAGCGTGAPAAPVPAGPPVSELRIGMQEYRFQLSAGTLRPGPVEVTVTNAGSTGHDVRLLQGERQLAASDVLPPGGRQTLQLDVAAGVPVLLDCTVGGHAEAGMTASLAVADS